MNEFENCIRGYLWNLLERKQRSQQIRLYNEALTERLMWLLSVEWLRDSKSLRDFLLALLKRWRKIDQPRSVWRRRTVIDQMSTIFGHDRVTLMSHLQQIGAIPRKLGRAKQHDAWLAVIGQDVSRELRRRRSRPVTKAHN